MSVLGKLCCSMVLGACVCLGAACGDQSDDADQPGTECLVNSDCGSGNECVARECHPVGGQPATPDAGSDAGSGDGG